MVRSVPLKFALSERIRPIEIKGMKKINWNADVAGFLTANKVFPHKVFLASIGVKSGPKLILIPCIIQSSLLQDSTHTTALVNLSLTYP
jgi:hypothetical protein